MESELNKFLAEGMKKYKEASRLMVLFGKTIEKELQDILKNRKEWGPFKPEKTKETKSTKYWHEYPALNAEIKGTIKDKQYTIRIGIIWYDSKDEYPYYTVQFAYEKPNNSIIDNFISYEPKGNLENLNDIGLKMYPDPNDFNLKRDFNLLLDEFIKIISK